MNILTVIGARPQFIKAATISRDLAKHSNIHEILVHTGQHYDHNMSNVFFDEMQIPRPAYTLVVGGGTHGAMTGSMLAQIEEILMQEKPELVLVYGDTNSTLAGALAAAKLHIPVAHVEAGLRSFNKKMPEEVNRVLTDHISRWLFCPTETAVQNLVAEGIVTDQKKQVAVANVGDIMYDALLFYKHIAKPTAPVTKLIDEFRQGFYLATVHRAENTDESDRLHNILRALQTIAAQIPVVLPLHPRTGNIVKSRGWSFPDLAIIEPVGYFDMITLLSKCRGVLTDSGGLQKEAYIMQKQCITLRDETEWVELLATGHNRLAGADYDRIIAAETAIREKAADDFLPLYGDGHAGEKIVAALAASFT